MPTDPAIAVDRLRVCYGELAAVDGLSFEARRGEVTALLGPNGAGKTTTIETLEGYHRRFEGGVRVLGMDPARERARLVSRIGVMLQDGGVYTGIRPLEALRLFASYYEDPLVPEELLERLELDRVRRTPWRRLSGGERQRLSLGLALVGRPEVAFLDEPTAGIDVSGRQLIREIIGELRAGGVCVLLATHDLDEAEKVADKVVIIDRGHLVAEGSPAELRDAGPGDGVHFGAPPGMDTSELAAALGSPVSELAPGEYRVEAPGSPDLVASLTALLAERNLPLADLRVGRKRLEDVFLRLIGEERPRHDGQPGEKGAPE